MTVSRAVEQFGSSSGSAQHADVQWETWVTSVRRDPGFDKVIRRAREQVNGRVIEMMGESA